MFFKAVTGNPFYKMAELIRTTLLGAVSAVVAAYSIFITVGGTMSWALTGIASEPVKELDSAKHSIDWFFYDGKPWFDWQVFIRGKCFRWWMAYFRDLDGCACALYENIAHRIVLSVDSCAY